MKNTTKTCLFGGALFAAGIAAQANAQINFELNFGGAYPTSFTVGYGYDGYTFGSYAVQQYVSYAPGTSPVPSSYANHFGFGGYGYVSSTYMLAYGFADGVAAGAFAYGFGRSYAYFSVDSARDVIFNWDLTTAYGGSDVTLVDWTNGGVLLFSAADFTAGTFTYNLQAGILYALFLDAGTAYGSEDNFAWASATFTPSPSAAALLGLGGLVAVRRRR